MSADEKNVQVAEPETVPVGKRCRRIVSMDEKDMAHAIHTDYGLDPMTFLPDMDVLNNGMFDCVLDAVEAYEPDAVTAAYALSDRIHFDNACRRSDIGRRALQALKEN